MITQERLQEKYSYEPTTGMFTRKEVGGKNKVGRTDQYGYLVIKVDGMVYKAHRLAWLYMNGEFPKGDIDHINHAKADNQIKNLRVVTHSENHRNRGKGKDNTSGFTGVCWHKRDNKWLAQIMVEGVNTHLGYFTKKEDAIAARAEANIKYNFHANHGV
tara:strand:+ start:52 stop:528 length:477 start_codon:yes stop_codon:yes gene_type:complete